MNNYYNKAIINYFYFKINENTCKKIYFKIIQICAAIGAINGFYKQYRVSRDLPKVERICSVVVFTICGLGTGVLNGILTPICVPMGLLIETVNIAEIWGVVPRL